MGMVKGCSPRGGPLVSLTRDSREQCDFDANKDGSSAGLASSQRTVAGGDGCNRLRIPYVTDTPAMSAFWSWFTWGCSVAVSSLFFSAILGRRDVNVLHDSRYSPSVLAAKGLTYQNSQPFRKSIFIFLRRSTKGLHARIMTSIETSTIRRSKLVLCSLSSSSRRWRVHSLCW